MYVIAMNKEYYIQHEGHTPYPGGQACSHIPFHIKIKWPDPAGFVLSASYLYLVILGNIPIFHVRLAQSYLMGLQFFLL